jgi:ribosomal protein S18 acetylase RimI-like enzyme
MIVLLISLPHLSNLPKRTAMPLDEDYELCYNVKRLSLSFTPSRLAGHLDFDYRWQANSEVSMSRKIVTKDGRTVWLRPAIEGDAADLIREVDGVAREGKYFIRSRFEMDVEKERAFIAKAKQEGNLMLMAILDERLVGWTTLFRANAEFLRHTAELGMGVIHEYRGIGIGTAMMDYALAWAADHGIEKVNLGVRASNHRAKSLYERFGFVQEGHRAREIKDLNGCYDDNIEMAYFVSSPQASLRAVHAGETGLGA